MVIVFMWRLPFIRCHQFVPKIKFLTGSHLWQNACIGMSEKNKKQWMNCPIWLDHLQMILWIRLNKNLCQRRPQAAAQLNNLHPVKTNNWKMLEKLCGSTISIFKNLIFLCTDKPSSFSLPYFLANLANIYHLFSSKNNDFRIFSPFSYTLLSKLILLQQHDSATKKLPFLIKKLERHLASYFWCILMYFSRENHLHQLESLLLSSWFVHEWWQLYKIIHIKSITNIKNDHWKKSKPYLWTINHRIMYVYKKASSPVIFSVT